MGNIKSSDFPIKKFMRLYERHRKQWEKTNLENCNAFYLSTSVDGFPSSRTVLLKAVDQRGFVFYTNLNSRKAKEIKINPKVSLLFHWQGLRMQVRVQGVAKLVTKEEADSYFATRPYLSQIGAWASKQSEEMASLLDFSARVTKFTMMYPTNVPRPEHWSGFIIEPQYFEFWQEKAFRLHLRKAYKKINSDSWQEVILYP